MSLLLAHNIYEDRIWFQNQASSVGTSFLACTDSLNSLNNAFGHDNCGLQFWNACYQQRLLSHLLLRAYESNETKYRSRDAHALAVTESSEQEQSSRRKSNALSYRRSFHKNYMHTNHEWQLFNSIRKKTAE
jgi:hypothetical protein